MSNFNISVNTSIRERKYAVIYLSGFCLKKTNTKQCKVIFKEWEKGTTPKHKCTE